MLSTIEHGMASIRHRSVKPCTPISQTLMNFNEFLKIFINISTLLIRRKAALSRSNDCFPIHWILIRCQDKRLIGHASAAIKMDALRSSVTVVIISSVVIDLQVRGLGIGRWLMQAVETELQQKGCKRIELCTTDKQNFYSKLGYQTIVLDKKICDTTRSRPSVSPASQSNAVEALSLLPSLPIPPPPPLPFGGTCPNLSSGARCIQPKIWMYKSL